MSIIKTASLLLAASIISQVIGAVLLRPRTDNISWVPGLWYPWDTSWISKFSALGDSYAAGLGAGHAMSEGDQLNLQLHNGGFFSGYCYQYSDGYANIVNTMLRENIDRKFQYLPCSGAVASHVLSDQVPLMDSPQLVTLSIGGNDAGLGAILNACVYQWWPFTQCDNILQEAKDKINSPEYTKGLTDVLNAIFAKMDQGSWARVYWVGYARFFSTDDASCDSITWAILKGSVNFANPQYLTTIRRQAMNDLVDLVNNKIQDIVKAASPQKVTYVDWQDSVTDISGRYCEPSVNELWFDGYGLSQDREQTVFYEWGTTKDDDEGDELPAHDELEKRQTVNSTVANMTFEGSIANYIDMGMAADPDGYVPIQKYYNITKRGSWMPDRLGRVFHPTKYGHMLMANKIFEAMAEHQAAVQDWTPLPISTLGCTPAATTSVSTSVQSQPTPTPSVTLSLQCLDIAGNRHIQSEDTVFKSIYEFCAQRSNVMSYNIGSVNAVRLYAYNSKDYTLPASDAPDCPAVFHDYIMDRCHGNDEVHNPHNYKYGGAVNLSSGWTYIMNPITPSEVSNACDVSYRGDWDFFEIRGYNFDGSKLGNDGSGLRKQLDNNCGPITEWHFDWTNEDPNYAWYASGRALVGKKACIGKALLSSGGADKGNCHGAG